MYAQDLQCTTWQANVGAEDFHYLLEVAKNTKLQCRNIFTYLSLEVQCKNMHCVGCTWTEGKHVSHYTKCIDIPQGLSQHQED